MYTKNDYQDHQWFHTLSRWAAGAGERLPTHILRTRMIVFFFYFTRAYHWGSINKNGPKLKGPFSMKGINSYN